jgi:hypothetical protein
MYVLGLRCNICPERMRKKIARYRLRKYLIVVPYEVKVRIFDRYNGPVARTLMVEWEDMVMNRRCDLWPG